MNETNEHRDWPSLPAGLPARIAVARAALSLERAWPALAPVALGVAVFFALGLFGLWPALPAWLHAAVLFGALAGAGVWLWRRRALLRMAALPAALHRLETDAGLPGRPLEILYDLPAGRPRAAGRSLWAAETLRRARAIGRLRLTRPRLVRPGFVPRHAFAGAAVLLLAGAIVAGGQTPARLWAAINPPLFAPGAPPALNAWIDPPPYTAKAPLYLRTAQEGDAAPGPVAAPAGSTFRAIVEGAGSRPELRIEAGPGRGADRVIDFESAGEKRFELKRALEQGAALSVWAGGRRLARWPLDLIADTPPMAEFARAPRGTARRSLEVTWRGKDDYGLVDARLVISRMAGADTARGPDRIDLTLPGAAPKEHEAVSYFDLTDHPWAGTTVKARIEVEDARGQIGRSGPAFISLPAYHFSHPVAVKLIEKRRALYDAPERAGAVAGEIMRIAEAPGAYDDDLTVFLSLRYTAGLLDRDGPAAAERAGGLLWDIALHLEEGDTIAAEKTLREAIADLRDAMARDAPQEEILALTQRLQNALADYLRTVAQRAAETGGFRQYQAVRNSVTADNLMQMIDDIADLSRLGARGMAGDRLSQLEQLLENLALPGSGAAAQARQMMNALSDLALRQKTLAAAMEDGIAEQDHDPARNGAEATRRARFAARQAELTETLDSLVATLTRQWGETPPTLDRARGHMTGAQRALMAERDRRAAGEARAAADALSDTGESMARMLEQMRQAGGAQPLFDPLGRPLTGPGSDVAVPDRFDANRAQEILEELQRRAADWERPPVERDYLRRLLDRF